MAGPYVSVLAMTSYDLPLGELNPAQKKGRPFMTVALWAHPLKIRLAFDNLLPLVVDLLFQLGRRLGNRRKVLHPLERAAGVDHGAGVETLLARLDARVERAAPAAAENFDGLHRIGAAGQRPEYVEGVGRIDIFVNDDDVPAKIGTSMDLRCGEHRLAGMAGIALLDGNDVE